MVLAVPTQRTWSTNDIGTAAFMNSNVRDAVNFLLGPPVCITTATATQSIANATLTALQFDTNQIDTYSGHSTTVNNTNYYVPFAGIYQVGGNVGFASNNTGIRLLAVYQNGAQLTYAQTIVGASSVNVVVPTSPTMVVCAAGDYLSLYAFQSSGGSLSTATGQSQMAIRFVHS